MARKCRYFSHNVGKNILVVFLSENTESTLYMAIYKFYLFILKPEIRNKENITL